MKKEIGLYELILLFSYTATEKEIVERVEYYRDSLLKKGSQVMVKNYGKISLAYPIKGFDTATSVQLTYLGNGNIINQLQTEIKREKIILRSLTTKLNDQKVEDILSQTL
jgi:ribosomal protein S6